MPRFFKEVINVDDVIETANHFRCIDIIIENAKAVLTEKFIKKLHLILKNGTSDSRKKFEDILDFHVKFEQIHPFQDGNGRVERLIMFKEWSKEKGYLTDTCLTAQDRFKVYLEYFRITY